MSLETKISEAIAALQAGNVEAWEELNPLAWGEGPGSEDYSDADRELFRHVIEELGIPEEQWLMWHCALIDQQDAELEEFIAGEGALAKKRASVDRGLNDGLTARASKR